MDTQQVEKIITSIAGKVQQLLPVDRFYALLYDADRATVQVVESGIPSYTRALDSQLLPDTLLLSETTKTYPRNDVPLSEQLKQEALNYWPDGALPLTWMGAPMIIENRAIGALIVENHRKSTAFGQTGPTMLTTIARQAAVAIENARLYARLERKITSQRAVHTVSQRLSEAVKLGEAEIFKLIDEQASAVMDTSNMYIALYDPATDMVSFPLMRINGQSQEVPSRSSGRGRTEWIIHHKEPILIKTKEASEEWYRAPGRGEYIGNPLASWIGVPMIYEEQVLGVIAAYHETDDYIYDEDDLEALQTIAAATAVALENAHLYKTLEQSVQQLATVQKIGVKITETLDLNEVLGNVAASAQSLLSADFCTLFVYNSERERFEMGVRKGKVEKKPILPSPEGIAAQIAKDQSFIFCENRQDFPEITPLSVDKKEILSFAGVPLIAHEKTVGVLFVDFFEQHRFSEGEREVIRLLANQAAVAIENARNYQSLQDANKKIAETQDMLTRLRIASDFVHRMRNLAGTIPIWTDFLRNEIISTQNKMNSYLESIEKDTNNLLSAAEQLLSSAPPQKETLDVTFILEAILRQVQIQYEDITLNTELEPDLHKVYAVASQLSSAFWAIISNGLEAMPNGGSLSICAVNYHDRNDKSWIRVTITDTGGGIPENIRHRIFEPYYTTKEYGRGYGLWSARNAIESIGGHVDFVSEENIGTTFTVLLPAGPAEVMTDGSQ